LGQKNFEIKRQTVIASQNMKKSNAYLILNSQIIIILLKIGQIIISKTLNMASFGNFIKKEREKREWTQTE
jgi:hypothetical protein